MTAPRDDIAGLSERLAKAVYDGMEGAGTLPAKDSVKVRPKDWHKIIDVSREATTAIDAQAAQLADLRSDNDKMHDLVDQLTQAHHDAEAKCDALQARVKELEALVYVPGSWHCPKCKFTLLQSNLNAQDGAITARDTPGDKCPNCNGPLWRCSWKNDAFEMQERAVEQMERAKAAESRALRAEQERDEAYERLKTLAEARALSGVRKLVAGWNGEGREDGPYTRHPDELGATLPKTNCGAIYQLDDAMTAARDLVRRLAGPEKEGK